MLPGNVEAVVVDLPGLQDVLRECLGGLDEVRGAQSGGKQLRNLKMEGNFNVFWLRLVPELKGYWVNEGADVELSPRAALVQVQLHHRSIQLGFSKKNLT